MRSIWLSILAGSLFAQIQLPTSTPAQKAGEPHDPLGRDTPQSAMTGFLRAVQGSRYRTAALYLQVPESRRETQGVKLAQDLQILLDTSYNFPLSFFSNKPEGAPEENVAEYEDHMGEITVGEASVDMIMVRVNDPQDGRYWLISAGTLAHVPALSSKVTGYEYIQKLPAEFQRRIFGLTIAQWLGGVLLGILAYVVAWLIVLLVNLVLSRTKFRIGKPPRGTVVLLAFLIHTQLIHFLAIPLLYRSYYRRAVGLLFLCGIAWLLSRGIDALSDRMRMRALSRGQMAEGSWVVLGRRIVKALLVVAFGLVFLAALGFDMSTALAGLGIGGIAVALAAQKTIENLFGGVSVASDEVIRVGDTLRLGNVVGNVTDIGLRSTRIRTTERTELSIPNGALATMNVENLSMRDKILFNTNLGLTYETTAGQLEQILTAIRELFTNDPRVDNDGRVRFSGYADSSLTIEIFVYILTTDFNEFAKIREELLFRIMQIVSEAGSGFAFPSRTVYVVNQTAEESRAQTALPSQTGAP